jgi:hypothetical protein
MNQTSFMSCYREDRRAIELLFHFACILAFCPNWWNACKYRLSKGLCDFAFPVEQMWLGQPCNVQEAVSQREGNKQETTGQMHWGLLCLPSAAQLAPRSSARPG